MISLVAVRTGFVYLALVRLRGDCYGLLKRARDSLSLAARL